MTRTLPTGLLLRKLLTFTLITCDIVATQIWKETPTLVTPIKWYSKSPSSEVARGKEKIGESDFTYKAGLLLGHYLKKRPE